MNNLDPLLDLCQTHDPALTQSRHSVLETFEPLGSLAFEALLGHVDQLPSSEVDHAVKYASRRLATAPLFMRREVATSHSLRPLMESASWPLIRSLTLELTESRDLPLDMFASSLCDIESLVLLGGSIGKSAISGIAAAQHIGRMTSLDLSRCRFAPEAEDVLRDAPLLSQLRTLHGITTSELESSADLQLECVSGYATAKLIHLLNDRLSHTLRHLTLSCSRECIDDVVGALLESRCMLGRLSSLTLSMEINDETFAKIIRCRELPNLEHLTIQSDSMTGKGVKTLQSAAFLPSLKSLDLSAVAMGDAGLQDLADVAFNRLERLILKSVKAGDDGAIALSKSPHFASVRFLDLSLNAIGSPGMTAIAASNMLNALMSLDVQGNPIGLGGAEAIAAIISSASLRHLWINNVDAAGVAALAEGTVLSGLESLALGFLPDGSIDDAATRLVHSEVASQLRSLSLAGAVTDKDIQALSETSTLGKLKRLSLSGDITGEGIESLAASRQLSGMWQLALDLCPMGDRGARAIARSDSLHGLVDLRVAYCQMTDKGSAELARSGNVQRLRWISLGRELLYPWLDSPMISNILKARIQRVTDACDSIRYSTG